MGGVQGIQEIAAQMRGQASSQFLMLGLEGEGKTTLLYKLKIPGWKRHEITRDIAQLKTTEGNRPRDPGYHYEEFRSSAHGPYGIWEIPGNDAMRRLWPMFYRYLHMDAVLFVVDAFKKDCLDLTAKNLKRLNEARQTIRYLLNEDELRTAAFVLILNVRWEVELDKDGTAKYSGPVGGPDIASRPSAEELHRQEEALFDMLGVPEIEQDVAQMKRFRKHSFNCAEITRKEPKWEKLLKDIFQYRTSLQ
eukprot:TRINITY_DN9729_c3_g1_i1.p1 TRINITY_DN9729_c3_g1~~TRINITY_DN9729_c3_g1_i1.p1  ORF type:complete len:249 (+),score=33.66 TRINITY_DN9729_c3_g1_i1:49-795(+)